MLVVLVIKTQFPSNGCLKVVREACRTTRTLTLCILSEDILETSQKVPISPNSNFLVSLPIHPFPPSTSAQVRLDDSRETSDRNGIPICDTIAVYHSIGISGGGGVNIYEN